MEQNRLSEIFDHCEPILICYGGSIAYGTNTPTSDTDIRGIYMNRLDEFIGITPTSEQYCPNDSDTVIYSLKKIFHLLMQCNPNVIEILGLQPEHYLYVTDAGKIIIDHSDLFLSKRAIYTFGNYAKAQLNRLINKSGRANDQLAANEVRSIAKALVHLRAQEGLSANNIRVNEENGVPVLSIRADLPIDKFARIGSDILNIHSDYKDSSRNKKAIEHSKLAKHMMHLLRLYMMAIDILQDHQIVTYRSKEHDLLMDIRSGKYLMDDQMTPSAEFVELLNSYTAKFEEAAAQTTLPDQPDMSKINDLMMTIVKNRYFA